MVVCCYTMQIYATRGHKKLIKQHKQLSSYPMDDANALTAHLLNNSYACFTYAAQKRPYAKYCDYWREQFEFPVLSIMMISSYESHDVMRYRQGFPHALWYDEWRLLELKCNDGVAVRPSSELVAEFNSWVLSDLSTEAGIMWKTGDPRVLKKRLKDLLPDWRIRGTHEAYVGFVSNHRAKFKWVAIAAFKDGSVGTWAAITMLTSAERAKYIEQITQAHCAALKSCDDNTIMPAPLMHIIFAYAYGDEPRPALGGHFGHI